MPYKILAVDDDPDIIKILKFNMISANYDIVTASNGKEAMQMLEQHNNIDLILLDNMMPEMDGIEVLNEIKKPGSKYCHIPVVMQTAKIQDYDVFEGIQAGAINYMIKPYTREMLMATVEAVLRDISAIKKRCNCD